MYDDYETRLCEVQKENVLDSLYAIKRGLPRVFSNIDSAIFNERYSKVYNELKILSELKNKVLNDELDKEIQCTTEMGEKQRMAT